MEDVYQAEACESAQKSPFFVAGLVASLVESSCAKEAEVGGIVLTPAILRRG